MTRRAASFFPAVSANRDLAAERERRHQLDAVPAPELPWVVPARRPPAGEQSHVLVRRRHQLGAIDGLQRGGAAEAPDRPLAREPERGRERAAVEAVDHLHQPVLVMALEAALELAHPRTLAVA